MYPRIIIYVYDKTIGVDAQVRYTFEISMGFSFFFPSYQSCIVVFLFNLLQFFTFSAYKMLDSAFDYSALKPRIYRPPGIVKTT